jgi:hypothetical protein
MDLCDVRCASSIGGAFMMHQMTRDEISKVIHKHHNISSHEWHFWVEIDGIKTEIYVYDTAMSECADALNILITAVHNSMKYGRYKTYPEFHLSDYVPYEMTKKGTTK